MLPYWLLFLFPSLIAFSPIKANTQVRNFGFIAFAFFSITLIGLRYKVGGDWDAYLIFFDTAANLSLIEAMEIREPGYMALNWLSAQIGLGIAGVNLTCGAIFTYGLLKFCQKQPMPWLGLAVATPYLLIVVAMGYTRQSAALGFIFLALSVWSRGNFLRYSILVLCAALFHKAAAIMWLFSLFIDRRHLWIKFSITLPIFFIISFLLMTSFFNHQWSAYIIQKSYHSRGGIIRLCMSMLPAIFLLIFRKRFSSFPDHNLWLLIALANLVCLLLVTIYSTFIDRLAIYLAPIQVAILSRAPALIQQLFLRLIFIVGVVLTYGFVLWIWLNFAHHAELWLPYRWIVF